MEVSERMEERNERRTWYGGPKAMLCEKNISEETCSLLITYKQRICRDTSLNEKKGGVQTRDGRSVELLSELALAVSTPGFGG